MDDITETDVDPTDLVTVVTPEERSDRAEAKEWLRAWLGTERHDSSDVKTAWKKEGGSERTLQRARGDLGVVVERDGFGTTSRTYWSPPGTVVPTPKSDPTSTIPGTTGKTATDQEVHTEVDSLDAQSCQGNIFGTTDANFYNRDEF